MKTELQIRKLLESTKQIQDFNEFCNRNNGIEFQEVEHLPYIRMILLWVLEDNGIENKKPVEPVILDNNPLSIACYLEEHPDVELNTHDDIGKCFDVKRTERALKSKDCEQSINKSELGGKNEYK